MNIRTWSTWNEIAQSQILANIEWFHLELCGKLNMELFSRENISAEDEKLNTNNVEIVQLYYLIPLNCKPENKIRFVLRISFHNKKQSQQNKSYSKIFYQVYLYLEPLSWEWTSIPLLDPIPRFLFPALLLQQLLWIYFFIPFLCLIIYPVNGCMGIGTSESSHVLNAFVFFFL